MKMMMGLKIRFRWFTLQSSKYCWTNHIIINVFLNEENKECLKVGKFQVDYICCRSIETICEFEYLRSIILRTNNIIFEDLYGWCIINNRFAGKERENSIVRLFQFVANRSRNGRSRMPVTMGSPLVNFFPGVRGDEIRVEEDEVNWSSADGYGEEAEVFREEWTLTRCRSAQLT